MKPKQDSPRVSERTELEQQLEALRQEIRRLQLEQDILHKANELIKKGLGIGRQILTNREKTGQISTRSNTTRSSCSC